MPFSDIEILARTIKCEAGNEGDIAMKAFASVIINRINVDCGEFRKCNTIRDVVFMKGQFDCSTEILDGQYNPHNIYNMRPEQIHYDIAEWAIAGNKLFNLGSALWFVRPLSLSCQQFFPSNVGKFVARINQHCFYNPTVFYAET